MYPSKAGESIRHLWGTLGTQIDFDSNWRRYGYLLYVRFIKGKNIAILRARVGTTKFSPSCQEVSITTFFFLSST